MRPRRFFSTLTLGLALGAPPSAPAVDQVPPAEAVVRRGRLDVDVWVNKDEGGVYRPGESMRIYFRTNAGAYVLLYNIDTEGYIHLVYPYGPADPPFVQAGRTCVVPSRSDPYELVADGPPGVEYVVALASPVPFRNLPWYLADTGRGGPPEGGDEGEDMDAGYVVGDPYVGMERLNRRIVPPGQEEGVASSDTYFYIERRVDYPRYVCADCHYHQPYFDPYGAVCSVVDIRVDATWVHYAPVRWGIIRPRYYYTVRSAAPSRYRLWKRQWSSKDGIRHLRERFIVSRDLRGRREDWLKDRARTREYFDLRRMRSGRIWQGRDEVLRLRDRREQVQRQRLEARERARDEQLRQDRAREDRLRSSQPKDTRSEVRERRAPDRGQPPPKGDREVKRRDPPPDRSQGDARREERLRERQDRSEPKEERKEDRSKSRGRSR